MLIVEYKKKVIRPAAILLCLGVISVSLYLFTTKQSTPPQKMKEAKTYSDLYEGFEKGTVISKTIMTGSGDVHEIKTFLQTSKATALHERNIEGGSYEARYHIYNTQSNIDISFVMNKKTNQTKATISGLKRDEAISFKKDGKEAFTAVPADWSGKITLQNSYPDENICTLILKKGYSTRSVCHDIKKKGSAT